MNIFKNKAFRVCLALLILTYPFTSDYRFFYSTGESMLPTYKDGEMLLVYKSSSMREGWEPLRGQVIVVEEENGEDLVKRVVGLEGDTVHIKGGKIYVNGKKYEDEWTYQDITFWMESEHERSKKPKEEWLFMNSEAMPVIVPQGYVWVIGDNREESWMGKVKIKDIKGWVVF